MFPYMDQYVLLMYRRVLVIKQDTIEFWSEIQETEMEQRTTSAEMTNPLEYQHLGRLKRAVILHI